MIFEVSIDSTYMHIMQPPFVDGSLNGRDWYIIIYYMYIWILIFKDILNCICIIYLGSFKETK